MAQYTPSFPDAGSNEAVTTTSTNLTGRKSTIDTAVTSVSALRTVIDAATFWGQAADAWRGRSAEPETKLTAVSTAMNDVIAAIATYVDATDDVFTNGPTHRDAVYALDRDIALLPFKEATPSYDPATDYLDAASTLTHLRDNAVAALQTMYDTRVAAEAALIGALRAGEPANWAAMSTALRAAGITSGEDLTQSEIAQAMHDYTMAGRDLFDPAFYENLNVLFETFGGDPDIMAQYFNKLGGTNTALVIESVGNAGDAGSIDPALALTLAAGIRSGLGLGSQNWTESTANSFIDGMIEQHPIATAFLLSDPDNAPMGPNLSVAIADAVDEFERNDPQFTGWDYYARSGGASYLSMLESPLDTTWAHDLGARAMGMLGQHPNEALEWLTEPGGDAELGTTRVEYWYGQRDSSTGGLYGTGDGFEGVSRLWAGALQADGGLYGGADDVETMERIAILSGEIFQQFSDNPAATGVGMSDTGSLALASALALQFPQIIEIPITGEQTSSEADDQFLTRPILIGDPPMLMNVPLPNVGVEAVTDLLGLAQAETSWSHLIDGQPTGSAVIAAAATDYQNQILQLAGNPDWSGEMLNQYTGEMALDRFAAAQGIIDGSDAATQLSTAADRDEATRAAAEFMSQFVSGAPVPGPALVGYVGGLALGNVVDGGVDYMLENHWATEYRDALAELEAGSDARTLAVEGGLEELIASMVESGQITESPSTLSDALGRYRDAAAAGQAVGQEEHG